MTMTTAELDAERIFRTKLALLSNETKRRLIELLASSLTFPKTKDEEIIEKFQLLDNQRNQQKREICRRCFQEGIRGSIYGIKYFYRGDETWNPSIPTKGKAAESGCIGCPWYDIEEWRKRLNEMIGNR